MEAVTNPNPPSNTVGPASQPFQQTPPPKKFLIILIAVFLFVLLIIFIAIFNYPKTNNNLETISPTSAPLISITETQSPTPYSENETPTPSTKPTSTSTTTPFPTSGATLTPAQTSGDKPVVVNPQANTKVTSPLTVKGTAPSNWFFEGQVVIKLLNAQRQTIVTIAGNEVVPGSWTSGNPVEFEGTMNFTTSSTNGFVVIENDNPSGLPQHQKTFEVPVTF